MNNDKIIEGNKLIAKFMGGHLSDHPELNGIKVWHGYDLVEGRLNLPTTLTFHSSWDWLMPCIGKISNECEEPEELDGLKYALLCNDIDTAWRFVVDYLTSSQKVGIS